MLYEVNRPNSVYDGLPICFEGKEGVARFLEESGAPAVFEVTAVFSDGSHLAAVNGKHWLENYRLDQLRRAALDNTAPDDDAPDDDAPIYTCAEPPAWHDDAWQVAQIFQYLMSDRNFPFATYTENVALKMAISGIVHYQNLEKETTDFQTVSDYVWALIRSKWTG